MAFPGRLFQPSEGAATAVSGHFSLNCWNDRWVGAWFLLTLSLVVSVVFNHLRAQPIRPWVAYTPRELLATVDYAAAIRLAPTYIDVRGPGDFQRGHIPGAINLTSTDVVARGLRPRKGAPFVVYCKPMCGLAQSVGEALEREGYSPIYVLEGGFDGWKGEVEADSRS